jgi:methionyl-tRNA formyltransferase
MPNKEPIRIVFAGTPDFSVPCLKALIADARFEVVAVISQPDAPSGRGKKLQAPPVKICAVEHELPVLQPTRLRKNEEFFASLEKFGPIDFLVVVAFGQILPKRLLDWPRVAPINVHASLLPRWRGAAPIQRALLSGDSQSGVCIMHMEAGLDVGPVYAQQSIRIPEGANAGWLHDELSACGAKLLVDSLPQIASRQLEAKPQTNEGITYAQKIDKSELLIPWDLPSTKVLQHILAFSPFPGAYTFVDKKRLKILSARAFKENGLPPYSKAGSLHHIKPDRLAVACHDAWIEILDLQPEGRARMQAAEFLRGCSGRLPQHFGSNL